ncbi:M23 family metallopeptidase [bacterium]|nr:M23 family metallopeptidase [bacterium]
MIHHLIFLVALLSFLPGCGTFYLRPSRARHQTVSRADYPSARRPSSERSHSDSVVARTETALQGEPLAYELDQARFSWPLNTSAVSSLYGPRWGRTHEGIDLAAPTGTPVKSARGGKVIYAENGISGYGKMVVIRHSPNFATVYAHLSRIGVRVGDFVERGKVIGRVGMTGRATSPHLHFEIRHRRVAVDPLVYLPGRYALSQPRAN